MAGQFLVRWLITKQFGQNGAQCIDVVHNAGKRIAERAASVIPDCPSGLWEQDRKEDAFLRDHLVEGYELQLMLLALRALPSVFTCWLSVFP